MADGLPDRLPRRALGHAEVYALFILLSFLAARFLPLLALPYPCPWKALTGIPCATCGMTHAFVHLAHGELRAAVAASPLGALLAFVGWTLAALDLVRLALGWPLPRLGRGSVRALACAGLGALMVNWAFLVLVSRP
ncbi:MAG TPA: DUF2752 domain-containing protein [Anaeromyxobacteraceae bacterium]|nr:DUF2752 domain-containing protein [Anaeromyxobacteraceae bacterium]